MFTSNLSGGEVRFVFGHEQYDQKQQKKLKRRGQTFCTVFKKNYEGRFLINGGVFHAPCSLEDKFVKSTGRKIALTYALDGLHLSREERRRVWQDYWNTVGYVG